MRINHQLPTCNCLFELGANSRLSCELSCYSQDGGFGAVLCRSKSFQSGFTVWMVKICFKNQYKHCLTLQHDSNCFVHLCSWIYVSVQLTWNKIHLNTNISRHLIKKTTLNTNFSSPSFSNSLYDLHLNHFRTTDSGQLKHTLHWTESRHCGETRGK